MADPHEPLLVYDRIEANRRRTRQLLATFALALLPVASGATVWAMPLLMIPFMLVVMASPNLQQSMAQWSLPELVALEGGLVVLAFGIATLGLSGVTAFFVHRYGSSLLLRSARARLVDREQELELHRSVENLCIGAGLPKPRLWVIESSSPNAFAAGRDPEHASIAVTRGLLTLLDRRELEAVLAHELSHIGNQDVRLGTTLAALIATCTLPLTAVGSILGAVFRAHRLIGAIAVLMGAQLLLGPLMMIGFVFSEELEAFPPLLRWWTLHAFAAPLYLVFGAPLVGRLLRRAISRRRECLADADAVLLTRNPAALARALLKVATTLGAPLRVGPATVHLYFVDPLHRASPWLARWFRSHPPIEERLALLAGMGSGVAPSAFADAVGPLRAGSPGLRWIGETPR